MKAPVILLTFAAVVLAQENEFGNVCASHQEVVCQGQGNSGLITLGNALPRALAENCAAGDVYCCSHDDIQQVWYITYYLNFMELD
jgi:hypothetical protein